MGYGGLFVSPLGGWLASGIASNVTGSAFDIRASENYGFLFYRCSSSGGGAGGSAIFNLEASPDSTAWMIDSTYTATATQTGSAQIAKYYPYVRINVTSAFSAAGGSGALYANYAPGLL